MARIVIMMWPEAGHLGPTFALARALRSRGHDIVYFSFPFLEDLIRSRGFEYVPALTAPMQPPPPRRVAHALTGLRARVPAIAKYLDWVAHYDAMLQRAREAEPNLRRAKPDLILVDCLRISMVMLARRIGRPTISINTSFPTAWDPVAPPPSTKLLPSGRIADLIRTQLAWAKLLGQANREALWSGFSASIMADAWRMGVSPRHIGVRLPGLHFGDLTEIALVPEALDLPRARGLPNCVYAGPTLDLERDEPAFDWSRLRPGVPLVYCAFGTQTERHPELAEVARKIEEALGDGRCDLVLALGAAARDWRSPRPNVHVVERAPQLAILQRAHCFITHGGASSIKEAIWYGVPMIVTPISFDQPGNAARVAHHRLGAMVEFRTLTANALRDLWVTTDWEDLRANVLRMRASFRELEQRALAVDLVEQALDSRGKDAVGSAP